MEALLVLLAGGAAALALLGLRASRRASQQSPDRALLEAPGYRIVDAPTGKVVTVSGMVVPPAEPLEAPISGRPCVCWDVVAEERGASSNTAWVWFQIFRDRGGTDFVVEDGTGRALVRTSELRTALRSDASLRSWAGREVPPEVEEYLASRDLFASGVAADTTPRRFREGVVEPGEIVTVLGLARWEPDPTPGALGGGYRTVAMRLVIEPPLGGAVLVCDDPGLAKAKAAAAGEEASPAGPLTPPGGRC